MRKLTFTTFLFLMGIAAIAQQAATKPSPYAAIDAAAAKIPADVSGNLDSLAGFIQGHFTTDRDKTRAIFIWISTNIRYDIENMFAIKFDETDSSRIDYALKNHKGICEHYADLFTALCHKTGIAAVTIQGYTKQRGFVDFIPHAWSAARIDNSWYLFDPTWGAGYVSNGKYVRQLNESYFKSSPSQFIRSHMPFDYLWELLQHPVSNQAFIEGKTTEDPSVPSFKYEDSIKAWHDLSPADREVAAARRVEANGVRNALVYDYLRHLQVDIENNRRQAENDKRNEAVYLYNSALADYNRGVNDFNTFINYYNEHFKPEKPDSVIQAMIDEPDQKLKQAKEKVGRVTTTDAQVQSSATALSKAIDEAQGHVNEQKEWLKKYFGKSKFGRRNMFYRLTWFGIPLQKG